MKYKEEKKCLLISIVIHMIFFAILYKIQLKNIVPEIDNKENVAINLVQYKENTSATEKTDSILKESKNQNIIQPKPKENKEYISKNIVTENIVVKPEETKKETEVIKENIEKEINKENDTTKNTVEAENIDKKGNDEKEVIAEEAITYGKLGEKIGKNQNISGLKYQILNSKDPEYPIQAKKFRIKETIVIKTKFLVGLDGKIEEIDIISGTEKFGFRDAVKDCILQWEFSPIEYKGEKIKMYFYKDFIFKVE